MREGIEVSDYDIQSYAERNASVYNQPERRQSRYIVSATETEALAAAGRVQAGESFVDVARQVSIDPLAPKNGGNLGLVSPGQLAPALEEVIFSLEVGQISAPVNVADKWYVATVEAVQAGQEQLPQEEILADIEEIIADEEFASRWKELMDGLYADAEL
ncbi:MAG: hypothetical protein C4534_07740, partial [Gaiellales bacterium]